MLFFGVCFFLHVKFEIWGRLKALDPFVWKTSAEQVLDLVGNMPTGSST